MENAQNQLKIWMIGLDDSLGNTLRIALDETCQIRTFTSLDLACDPLGKLRRSPESRFPLLIVDIGKELKDFKAILTEANFPARLVLILSVCSDPSTIRNWLKFGVYDYLLHPVNEQVLRAKVEYAVEMLGGDVQTSSDVPIRLDAFSMTIRMQGKSNLKLTAKEFQLVSHLMRSHPTGMTREMIKEEVWGDVKVVSKTLDVHIFRLRKKLAEFDLDIKHHAGQVSVFTLEKIARS